MFGDSLFRLAGGFLGAFVYHVSDALDSLLDAVAGPIRHLPSVVGRALAYVCALGTGSLGIFGHIPTCVGGLPRGFLGGVAGLSGSDFSVMAQVGSRGLSISQKFHA